MTQQEIFEFIKENLNFSISEDYGRDYGGRSGMTSFRSFKFELSLKNPTTNEYETVASDSFSIDLE